MRWRSPTTAARPSRQTAAHSECWRCIGGGAAASCGATLSAGHRMAAAVVLPATQGSAVTMAYTAARVGDCWRLQAEKLGPSC